MSDVKPLDGLVAIVKKIQDWWNDQETHDALDQAVAEISRLNLVRAQQEFLLDQAPMQNAPDNTFIAGRAVTKFAYIHPETLYKLTQFGGPIFSNITQWTQTTLMPKGTVIYSSNAMPRIVPPPIQWADRIIKAEFSKR